MIEQNGLINIEQADAILDTELKYFDRQYQNVLCPKLILPHNIRAGQIYNIIFSHIRENFAISDVTLVAKLSIECGSIKSNVKQNREFGLPGLWRSISARFQK